MFRRVINFRGAKYRSLGRGPTAWGGGVIRYPPDGSENSPSGRVPIRQKCIRIVMKPIFLHPKLFKNNMFFMKTPKKHPFWYRYMVYRGILVPDPGPADPGSK